MSAEQATIHHVPTAHLPVFHAPGEDTLGGCEPRIWTACRTCGEPVIFCHASGADLRAIMRGGWRHTACEAVV
jgi:hypothetical protein